MAAKRTETIIARLPFFYGWVIVAIAFVTMAISVSVRTSFSLVYLPILDEFGWTSGLVAGAFSFGFLASAVASPLIGRLMDWRGPRFVIEIGVFFLAAGLLLATVIETPWQLYLTLGALVGVGANSMSYTAQSLFLPNWFVRRRTLAISIAFSGVGVGSLVLLPWLQTLILSDGWRAACWSMGILVIVVLGPINLMLWRSPQDVGLRPDGDSDSEDGTAHKRQLRIVDADWAAIEWTLGRAVRTARFWWIVIGFFGALFAWYAVQVHQTEYLVEVGFSPMEAAWALGLVAVVAIPGQIALGALSDWIGREWIWTIACAGFAVCYAALIALETTPSQTLLYAMVIAQGMFGYSLTSVMGPIVAEIFEGPHYGAIFGTLTIALIGGGAAGPLITGLLFDFTGGYRPAFLVAIVCCAISAAAIWIAAPRNVRRVAGRGH